MNYKLLIASVLFGVAFGAPQGFHLVSGDASAPTKDSTGAWVLQSGERAILRWDDFSIEHNESFCFQQKSSNSAVLNRVCGGDESRILGNLSSNGSVYLLNPQGVLIGPNARIETAGFIASTLDVLDADFLKNQEFLFSDGGQGGITNFGTVQCASGDIALLGRRVQNHGELSAASGSVVLGVGAEILLQPQKLPFILIRTPIRTNLHRDGASIEHTGAINALRVELRSASTAYAKAIESSGTIEALGVKKTGGEVYLVAQVGTCVMNGKITAGPGTKGRPAQGGFIEVSGPKLTLSGSCYAKHVLLDPTDIVLSTSADGGGSWVNDAFQPSADTSVINISTLQGLLASSNVTISTESAYGGAQGGSITVSNPLTWSAATTLTLLANSYIAINAAVSNTSSSSPFTAMSFTAQGSNNTAGAYAGLSVNAALSATNGNLILSGQGSPNGGVGALIAAAVTTTGSLTFQACTGGGSGTANHGVSITAQGTLQASQILVSGVGGSGSGGGHYGVQVAGAIALVGSNPQLQFLNCYGGSGGTQNIGLAINNSIRLSTGTIVLNTIHGGTGTANNFGVLIADGIRLSAPAIKGYSLFGGAGTGGNIGLYINGGILGDVTLANQTLFLSAYSSGIGSNESGIKIDRPTSNVGTVECGDGGSISLYGYGSSGAAPESPSAFAPLGGGNHGVHIANAAFNLGQTSSGAPAQLVCSGVGGQGTSSCHGVFVNTTAPALTLPNSSSAIFFFYSQGGVASGSGNHGVCFTTNFITSNGSINFGSITGGQGTSNNHGIYIASTSQVYAPRIIANSILSGPGSGGDTGILVSGGTLGSNSLPTYISLNANSTSRGAGGVGIQVSQGGKILGGTGSSAMVLKGSGGFAGSLSHGLVVTGTNSSIQATNSGITLVGNADDGHGVEISSGAVITAAVTGSLKLTGNSTRGGNTVNHGVFITDAPTAITAETDSLSIQGSTTSSANTAAAILITSSTDPIQIIGNRGVTLNGSKILLNTTKLTAASGQVSVQGATLSVNQ